MERTAAGGHTGTGRAWAAVAGWLLLIWGAIPLAGALRELVAGRGGRHLFLWATLLALAAVGVRLLRAAARRGLTPARLLVLAAVAALFVGLVWSLRDSPEEALHSVQYAVLGTLLFRALDRHPGGLAGYAAAAMAGIGLGINGLSAVLALVAVGAVQGYRPVRRRARLRDWRPVLLLAAADLLLLLFCLSNTPELQGRYARLLPAAASLDEVTAEYGHRHVDAVAGVFRSRLDRVELARQDRERVSEVAAILDRYAGEEQYRAFLARYPAHRDPLLVEARVHLFRRDRYAFLADQAKDDTDLRQQYARIAMGENRIMETVFPTVLGHSGYRWPETMRATLATWAGPAAPYQSPVSSELITVAPRSVLQTLVLLLLVPVLWGVLRAGRRER